MANTEIISFKIYMFYNNSEEPEVRRFGSDKNIPVSYYFLISKIMEVFSPKPTSKDFKICWKDEDGDYVALSTEEEFAVALASMQSNLKKFYVWADSGSNGSEENKIEHPGVYCDGCGSDIYGLRYKCVVCRDFDLCKGCEKAGIHSEHPMLKIPHPLCFDRVKLRKLSHILESLIPFNHEWRHHRRRHSHDGDHPDSCKKKKFESGQETGDESEEACHRRHSHKKSRKPGKCHYSQLMSEVFNYFDPANFEPRQASNISEETGRDLSHSNYLRTVGTTLQKLLDPLGVNVEFEVRTDKNEKGEEKKEEEAKEKEEKEKKEDKETARPTPSSQKEVRFATPQQQLSEVMKQKVEEITKILANQTMSNGSSADDGWVSYEELKRDSEESQPNVSGESVSNGTQNKPSAPQHETPAQENQNLYPDLNSQSASVDPKVSDSLEKMLAMGFTNEGGWLERLLEAKKGDIQLVLEILSPSKKN